MTPSPTHASSPHALVGRVLARWALVLLVALGSIVWAPAAYAEGTGEQVRITITAITPNSASGAADKGKVTITGVARNTTGQPIKGAQVYFWRSSDPITEPATLEAVLASDPSNPVGARMYEAEQNYQSLPAMPAGQQGTLPPDVDVPFSVEADLAGANSLGLHTERAAYLVGLQVKVAGQQGVFGRARSLFTVAPAQSVDAAQVVLLSAEPSRLAGNTFADDRLAQQLTGRLRRLLQAARTPGTTVVLDPALLDDVQAMAKGYTVKSGKASGGAAAKQWLADLEPLLTSPNTYRTLYGNPDVSVAEAAALPALLTRAAQLPTEHAMARLPLAVVPRDGVLDDELATFLEPLAPAVVMASDTESTSSVQSAGQLTIVRLADEATLGGPAPDPTTTSAQRIGRLHAEQVVADRVGDPLVTLLDTAEEAQWATAPAPWRRLVGLPQLVDTASSTPVAQFTESAASDPQPWLAQLGQLDADLRAWGELTGKDDEATAAADVVLPQAISQNWSNPAVAATWSQQVRSQYGNLLNGRQIQLNVTRTIVTTDPTQLMPVTVTNHLGQPVTVKVVFRSENPQRVDIDDSPLVTIPAGGTETIRVQINSRANGAVAVAAQLQTSSGRAIGPSHETDVTVTQMGRVGWMIIVGSGAVVLIGTAVRIRQVQHERRAAEAATIGAAAADGRLDAATRTGN